MIASGIALLQSAAVPWRSDPKADYILEQMHEKAMRITTIQAAIVQVKHFGIGRDPYDEGAMYFKHEGPNKDKVRMTYKRGGEVTQDLLIDGDKMTLYYPRVKQAIITSRSKQARQNPEYDFLAAPYSSVPSLKNRYVTAYLRDEDDSQHGPVGAAVIQLTPRAESSFKSVTFWIERASSFPVQYRVDEASGEFTTLTLTDIKKNGQVAADAFTLNLPNGTDKIYK